MPAADRLLLFFRNIDIFVFYWRKQGYFKPISRKDRVGSPFLLSGKFIKNNHISDTKMPQKCTGKVFTIYFDYVNMYVVKIGFYAEICKQFLVKNYNFCRLIPPDFV